ncbi:unnamed protein product, partial [Brenthis ino]
MLVGLALCDDKNATTTEATATSTIAPNAHAEAHKSTFLGDLGKAVSDIPEAFVATCRDALASLGKMFVDVPLGLVEAFKDGAEVIESVVLALVRGIFS